MKQENKGITLIALVITIIVLLILAAVSIATLTGENGILTKAQEAKTQNTKSQAEEEAKLAVASLLTEETTTQMAQEEKRQLLENELKQYDSSSTVEIDGTEFLVSHRGYEIEIDDEYKVSVQESFNAEEWDKTAASEDCFLWGSNIEGEEGYNAIVGWTEKIESYSLLRIPSRCQEIVCDGTYDGVTTNEGKGRAFTKNILKVELPETVTNIGTLAFSGHEYPYTSFQSLKEIDIPDSVINIGEKAFRMCLSLTNITRGNNVRSVGAEAFYCTPWFDNQPDGLVYIGKVVYQYKGTMPSDTKIELKEGTKQISVDAFFGCTGLTSITIPDSMNTIEERAFFHCTGLTSIIIPNGVTYIGYAAFGGWEVDQTINCRATSKPSGWDEGWLNSIYQGYPASTANIVWGYTEE